MAFDVSKLKTALRNVFSSMTDGDNAVFANGIASAIVTYVATGDVSTTDRGTVSGGYFEGSGTGKLTVTATVCANIIKTACDTMQSMTSGGADYLATQIGQALDKMAEDGEVNTSVSGTLTPPSSSPSPYSGTAKGSISCSSTALVSALKTLFAQMYSKREQEGYDGDKDFADKFAEEIDSFWTNGTISTNGQGGLAGSTGSGSIS